MNRIRRLIPYPLRAARLSIDLAPFCFWLIPRGHYREKMTERSKANGETIWWFRWLWFQISYSRWL
jgi:hypothetical protein